MLTAWKVTAVVATVLITLSVFHGLGNHTRFLSLPNIVEGTKLQWISVSLAAFSSGTSKAAVVAFLLVLQERSMLHKFWTWMLYFLAVTNIALNFAIVFIIIFQCTPVEATWNFTIQGQCYSREHLFGPVGIVQTCKRSLLSDRMSWEANTILRLEWPHRHNTGNLPQLHCLPSSNLTSPEVLSHDHHGSRCCRRRLRIR